MSVALKHLSGAQVSPADDARLYDLILTGQTGIVEGCAVTHLGSNQLQISAGWGVCHGRVFVVQQETINATVSSSGTVSGRLLLHIDVTADNPAVFQTQAAASLPPLTQEDINGNGTIYEIEMATYNISQVLISNLKMKFRTIFMQALKLSNPIKIGNADFDGSFGISLAQMGAAETDTGIQLYTHSAGTLSGSGTNGRVKATATATYSKFTIGGVSYSVRAGEDTSVDFVSGVWYTFVLDTVAKTINFKRGGGVSSKKLAQATTLITDVRKGKTFFAGDKELKTGAGDLGATGVFTSKYNDTVSIDVGFKPEKIVLSYQYDGGDTHIWLVCTADTPGVFTVHTSKGYNDTAVSNTIGTAGTPASGYGYIEVTDTGFEFMGYYASSGLREIRYVCY